MSDHKRIVNWTLWRTETFINMYLFIQTCKLPFGQYSVMILWRCGSMQIPMNLTIWSFWRSLICHTPNRYFDKICRTQPCRGVFKPPIHVVETDLMMNSF